jgi:hypothetical protein
METAILILSVILGMLSVINKILLLRGQLSGWISGMIIGVVSSFFFYVIGLKIIALAEVGFFLVMLFGYASHSKSYDGNAIRIFNIVMTGILLGLSAVLFTGKLTIYQLASSLSFIWGGYALAVSRVVSGWAFLMIAHIATSLAAYVAAQQIFAGLQVASAVVCLYGLVTALNRAAARREPPAVA